MYMYINNMTYNTISDHNECFDQFVHVLTFLKLYIIHALLEMCAYLKRLYYSESSVI